MDAILAGLPNALLGLLLGYYAWVTAACYARLLHADPATVSTDRAPDARLLWRALGCGLRRLFARTGTGDEPAWLAWIPAVVLAATYALLGVHVSTCTHVLALAWAAALLLLLALIDARTRLLPDALTLPLLWTGLALALSGMGLVPLPDALAAVMIAYVSLWLLAWLFLRLRGRDGMGGGDVKLLAAIGAWVGWPDVFLVLLCASVSGIVYALVAARGRHLRGQHPFGPHLAGAALVLLMLRGLGMTQVAGSEILQVIQLWGFHVAPRL